MKIGRLRVKRVDLVEMGASFDPISGEGSRVLLYKSATKEKAMTCKQCGAAVPFGAKECPKCGAKMDASAYKQSKMFEALPQEAKDHIAGLEKAIETGRSELAALTAKVAELTKAADQKAADQKPAPEDVLKGLTPEVRAVVEKSLADAAAATKKADEASAQVAKMMDEQRTAEVRKRVEADYTHAPGAKPEELTKALKNIVDRCPEDAKVVEGVLKAASASIKESELLKTRGSDGGAPGSVAAKIDALVAKKLETKTAKDSTDALSQIMREQPQLYREYRDANTVAIGRRNES